MLDEIVHEGQTNNLVSRARIRNAHDRPRDDVTDKDETTRDVNLINISVLVEMPQLLRA